MKISLFIAFFVFLTCEVFGMSGEAEFEVGEDMPEYFYGKWSTSKEAWDENEYVILSKDYVLYRDYDNNTEEPSKIIYEFVGVNKDINSYRVHLNAGASYIYVFKIKEVIGFRPYNRNYKDPITGKEAEYILVQAICNPYQEKEKNKVVTNLEVTFFSNDDNKSAEELLKPGLMVESFSNESPINLRYGKGVVECELPKDSKFNTY